MEQEFDNNGRHRLVDTDGTMTDWAAYTQYTYLRGMVGYTAYFANKEGILPAAEFCAMTGVTKHN